MRLLVTGALGHIGSALIKEYSKREDIELIRILDNLSTQRFCTLFELPQNVKCEFIEGDINDKEVLKRSTKDIDVVIHLAGIIDAPSTIKHPELTHKINFEGVKNVYEASLNSGVKKFLFPSTTSVYGEAEGIVSEDSPEEVYKPSSPYAEAKRKAEIFIQNSSRENGFNTNVLRMGTIFGASIGMRFQTAVNKFCYLASLKKPLTVWDSALNSKRPYLGLNDNIRTFRFLEEKGVPGELYNVLTENFAMGDIINAVRKFVPDVKIEITKSPILNQKSYEVSNERIKNLGFEFKDNLEDEIGRTISLFKGIKNDAL
jgi:UDP-glucose 4-epimerase